MWPDWVSNPGPLTYETYGNKLYAMKLYSAAFLLSLTHHSHITAILLKMIGSRRLFLFHPSSDWKGSLHVIIEVWYRGPL